VDELDLFVESHLLDDEIGALVGRETLVHPGAFGGRGLLRSTTGLRKQRESESENQ
jgi:hypothetical protein